jgi:hypothetical protein
MKLQTCLALAVALLTLRWSAGSQPLPVAFQIDTSRDTSHISPYIYGSNGQSDDRTARITARRIGGNRLTGYNWENNASNMGMDYDQSNANDDYLTWVAGIPSGAARIPGITLTIFHDTSLAMGCYSLVTLPAAGYVARDKSGPVLQGETAPSARFRQVMERKPAPLAVSPDTSDEFVYVDEEVHFLVTKYGSASTATGVRGYAVDNEPALWPSTHPRIHPAQTTCAEVIRKNVAVAKAIKAVDPSAEVFGGVFYGFNEQYNMQQAADWTSYSSYGRYVNAFLARLRDSSTAAGMRLVDVLDLHWYPDLDRKVALNENADSLTASLRMQVPRSLWDSSYTEPGWIGQWFSPVSLLPNIRSGIARYNPGTKIAITEFNYGGSTHISGGIALADVLGIFGKYGVYFASHWGALDGYVRSAYQIFRNYDGAGSAFGDLSVRAVGNDPGNCSVYAARRASDVATLDIIVLNKNFSRPLEATFTVAGPVTYTRALAYAFDGTGSAVGARAGIDTITDNVFTYSLPPLSVYHFVLGGGTTGVRDGTASLPASSHLEQNFPNPFNPTTNIRWTIVDRRLTIVRVFDVLGREVATLLNEVKQPGTHTVRFDGTHLASGVYICRVTAGSFVASRKMLLMR